MTTGSGARAPGGPAAAGGIRCMQMRGGTSKGLYFLASDLPADPQQRDELLLGVMGSGHPMQVDGVGGAHPLAAKVAVVSPSRREDADLDYLEVVDSSTFEVAPDGDLMVVAAKVGTTRLIDNLPLKGL